MILAAAFKKILARCSVLVQKSKVEAIFSNHAGAILGILFENCAEQLTQQTVRRVAPNVACFGEKNNCEHSVSLKKLPEGPSSDMLRGC